MYLLSVGRKFRKEDIQFSSWSFFLDFTNNMQTSQNAEQNTWWFLYYKCVSDTAVRKREVGGSTPAVGQISNIFLDTR